MRVLLDTNVWVSGLLWGGVPKQIIKLAENKVIILVTSSRLLDELEITLGYDKLQSRLQRLETTVDDLMIEVRQLVELYPAGLSPVVPELRDPNDVIVLAAAVSGNVAAIITGDADLLTLKQFAGIAIITPQAFLNSYFPTLGES